MIHRRYTRLAVGLSLVALPIALSSCAGDPDERGGTLPPLSPTGKSVYVSRTPSISSPGTEDMRIRAAYLGFLRSYVRAQHVSPPMRMTYLAQWLAGPRLSATVKSLEYDDRHYIRTVGADRPHIMKIKQTGNLATVEDCLDRTNIYIVDSRTGRQINGGRGPDHFWLMTILKETASGWRVYSAKHQPKRCTY